MERAAELERTEPKLDSAVLACGWCAKPAAPKRCTRCERARYCDEKCQRAHWKSGHREECVPVQQHERADLEKQDDESDSLKKKKGRPMPTPMPTPVPTETAAAAAAAAAAMTGCEECGECSICLEEMKLMDANDKVTTLPCSHRFHAKCINEMRRRGAGNNACPLCRAQLPKDADMDAETMFLDGLSCTMRGDHATAVKHFRRAVAADPTHIQAMNNLAFTVLRLPGQASDAEAERLYRRVLAVSSVGTAAQRQSDALVFSLTGLANLLFDSRREECEELTRRALQISNESDAHALELMGRIEQANNSDPRVALQWFRRGAAVAPQDADLWYGIASTIILHFNPEQRTLKDRFEAEEALRNGMRFEDSSSIRCAGLLPPLLICGPAATSTPERVEEGEQLLRQITTQCLKGRSHATMFNTAQSLIFGAISNDPRIQSQAGVTEETMAAVPLSVVEAAEQLLTRAVELGDDDDYLSALIIVLKRLGKVQARAQLMLKYGFTDPTDTAVVDLLQDQRRARELVSQAGKFLGRMKMDGQDFDPSTKRGKEVKDLLLSAEDLLRRAISLDSTDVDSHFKLALTLHWLLHDRSPEAEPLFQGRAQQTIASFKQALKIDPRHVESWMWLGFTLVAYHPNQMTQAAMCFHRILIIQPKHNSARTYYQRCLGYLSPEQRAEFTILQQQDQQWHQQLQQRQHQNATSNNLSEFLVKPSSPASKNATAAQGNKKKKGGGGKGGRKNK